MHSQTVRPMGKQRDREKDSKASGEIVRLTSLLPSIASVLGEQSQSSGGCAGTLHPPFAGSSRATAVGAEVRSERSEVRAEVRVSAE